MNARLPGFHEKGIPERTQMLLDQGALTASDLAAVRAQAADLLIAADKRVENVVGLHPLPWAVATNFLINGRDVLVPMAIEEPSVVAAASHAAKLVRASGGFLAEAGPHLLSGQIQLVDCPDWEAAERRLMASRDRLLQLAALVHPSLARRGAGPRDLTVRSLNEAPSAPHPRMLILELVIDTGDAMGANVINPESRR